MKKVLIIRFSSIGDIVLTTPVVRCIKQQIPRVEVHYLTKDQFRSVLEINPYIDKLICIDKATDIGGVLKDLKAEHYDYIVDLHKNLRSWKVIFSLFKPYGTFNKLNFRKWLICRLKINLLPDIHIVDRYFKAVSKLKVVNDGQGLDYFLSDTTDPWKKITELPRNSYIALVIGGKHATKQLPKTKLLELCQFQKGNVVILGGPEDRFVGEYLVAESTQYSVDKGDEGFQSVAKAVLYNTCGRLNLNESAVILKHADKVITHDTGLMHIAAAFKKDIISIWGNTIPAFGMYPYFPKKHKTNSQILEVKGLSCRPCSKLGFPECPKGHFRCMIDVGVKGEGVKG